MQLCSHTSHPSNPDSRDKVRATDDISISKFIDSRFPGLENTPAVVETCMYTKSPDEVSIIDRVPGCKNIAFACGFSGTGFKKAPAVGRLLHQLLTRDVVVDAAAFRLNRFNSKL